MKRFITKNLNNLLLIIIYILLFFVFAELVSLIFKDIIQTTEQAIIYSIALNTFVYISLLVSGIILLKKQIITDFKSLSSKNAVKVFCMCLATLGCAYFGEYFGTIISSIFGNSDSLNQQAIQLMLFSKYGIFLIIETILIGPIVEELVFRKAIHDTLRYFKLPNWAIISISSVLFGLIHVISGGDFYNIFPYLFMGVALGYLEMKSKNIFPSMFVHIFINSVATSLMIFLHIIEKYIPSIM